MMDILVVENPKNKFIKNMYVNDYNYYHKNSIKMRHSKLKTFDENLQRKKREKIEKPMPKMLYSSNHFFFPPSETEVIEKKKDAEAKFTQAKPIFNEIRNLVDNLSSDLNEIYKKEFFLTKPEEEDVCKDKDLNNVKILSSNVIYDENEANTIKANEMNFKDNLQFCNYEKFKFSTTGIVYPKKYNLGELPSYQGKDKMEKKYFNYRRKLKYPKQIYNPIGKFNEEINNELGKYSSSYGKESTKGRFAPNPLMNNYYDIIPIFDIYRDIKYIENRYVDNRFKYKMLPLLNSKLRKLDKLSDAIYRKDHMRKNLENILNINTNKFNKDLIK